MNRRQFTIAALSVVILLTVVFIPTSSQQDVGEYDPWCDLNDDGKIDIKDLAAMAKRYGALGTPVMGKAALEYDSEWLNITDQAGQYITITHGLNITNWNDENTVVSITGKTRPDGDLLRYFEPSNHGMQWSKTYGGAGSDYGRSLIQTSDGGYALAGGTGSSSAGMSDFWLVKTDSGGSVQWSKTYGGINNDYALFIIQTSDGGYALAGYTNSSGEGMNDFWLVKTNSTGNMQWNKTYGGTGYDEAYSLVETIRGEYTLAGITDSFGSGSWDFWLVHTDSVGNIQWNKTYGGTIEDECLSLAQTSDGGYALAGYTGSFGAGNRDFWLVKTNSTGNMQWNKTYGGTESDYCRSLVQTSDGGYALAGYTWSFGVAGGDMLLIKTDALGNAEWSKTYGGTGSELAYSLVQTNDGGYALAGYTTSLGAGLEDSYLVKTDSSGIVQWSRTYGGASDDWTCSLVQANDGGYALLGSTGSFGSGGDDFWLVKTDSAGYDIAYSGLAWTASTPNTITLCRATTDLYWNYVRVRIWKVKESP